MQDNSSSVDFSVLYDGEALSEHAMDVKELAPALLALAESFEIGNSILNGNSADVRLNIKATRPGSFEVTVEFTQAFVMSAQFLSGAFVTSAVHLKDIFLGQDGVISAIKFLRGRTATQTPVSETVIELETDQGSLRIKKEALPILESPQARKSLEMFVRPLNSPGVDYMSFRENGVEVGRIEKNDVPAFDVAGSDSSVTETIIPNQRLNVAAPNIFDRTLKWRLNDEVNTRWYGILDEDYLNDVFERRRPIVSGDVLIADVKLTHRTDFVGNISVSFDVIKVHRHVNTGVQQAMFDTDQSEN